MSSGNGDGRNAANLDHKPRHNTASIKFTKLSKQRLFFSRQNKNVLQKLRWI